MTPEILEQLLSDENPTASVVDPNALIRCLLFPESIPGQAVRRAIAQEQLLVSEAIMWELADVFARPKFNCYISLGNRQEFLRFLGRVAELVEILRAVRACRYPRDDKFLELAVNGGADFILTGDADLLALHPFRTILILTPAEWLAGVEPDQEK
ncbi:MAG TPA: putative toxin-antitoxin system toxin component, PIN family [Acidobacteriaceae bacterium]|jgi:putative PIN family toxin of toxin-antitoxin system|nr:putative toxin-antitoxin system toxin component, PIN family [Acidobacteriaceae bacterium]